MGVLQIQQVEVGEVGTLPVSVKMTTTDTLAKVTTAGYLNNQPLLGVSLSAADILAVFYNAVVSNIGGIQSASFGIFTVSVSSGVITLTEWVNPSNVLLPVVSGDFAVFNGTSGQIKDSGSAPSSASQPFVVVSPGSITTGHLLSAGNANGTIADSGIVPANLVQTSSATNTQSIAGSLFLNGNPVVVNKTVTATAAALATAGKVNIFVAPTVTAQIAILDIKVFLSTGLSGGGGNRLLSLADGTLVFNATGITAALLGTPIFTLWGGTGNPIASSAEQSISTAGANVYLQYVGGTTDYSTGSVIVSVTYAQITT